MIRTSKHILKYQTNKKLNIIKKVFDDYKFCLESYINQIINGELNLTINLSPKILSITSIPHANWRQIIYKQASEIIRSQIKKANSRRYQKYKKIYAKCIKSGKHFSFTSKRFSELKLKSILQSKYFTIPDLKNISITLDCRVFDIKEENNYFDQFIRIKTPFFQENKKRAITINVPIKMHKHSNKFKDWNRKNSIRLRQSGKNYFIDYIYEKPDIEKRVIKKSIGLDQGYKKLLACSNGKIYGQELYEIYQRLSKKIQGSKLFNKLLRYRSDLTNQVINKFYFDHSDIDLIVIEDLKNVKQNSKLNNRVMNKVQRWMYRACIDKLESLCQVNGVHLVKVNPAYTSQTCSNCGVVDKGSRNGELYSCLHCGYKLDADINAAINIHRLGAMYPNTQKSFL